MEINEIKIETHPWEPFMPQDAKVLIMGTFPPQPKRWNMNFYYPNRTNDFWYMMGIIFFNNKFALLEKDLKSFNLEKIKQLLTNRHIALHDTCRRIKRLKGNASDKYLEVVEPTPLFELLSQIPKCRNIATTGEKAAGVIANLTDTSIPSLGNMVEDQKHGLNLWRMPSTSRAYPLALEKKAEFYKFLFRYADII